MSDIETVEISNGPFRAELLNLGGILRRLDVPDLKGDSADITLGYRNLEDYRARPRFYGAIAGRYANRIGNARFSIDGKEHRLAVNSGNAHNLHSGPDGFDKKLWKLERHDASSATFSLLSPAGDMGFPGTLHVELVYALEADGLSVRLRATTDAATAVNLTHHAYFNLAGEASAKPVTDHWLQIPASRITPVDGGLIPTGELADVTGGPFDFRTPKPIGRDIGADDPQLKLGGGYDHNFVLDGPAGKIRRIATAYDPGSGRVMEVHSTEPGVQLYTGNHLAGGAPGTSGVVYPARGGFCLEPQKFPDSPNKPSFPSARLNPGETYVHEMAFRFRTAESVEEAFPG
jgi:aldose 1-epimerase